MAGSQQHFRRNVAQLRTVATNASWILDAGLNLASTTVQAASGSFSWLQTLVKIGFCTLGALAALAAACYAAFKWNLMQQTRDVNAPVVKKVSNPFYPADDDYVGKRVFQYFPLGVMPAVYIGDVSKSMELLGTGKQLKQNLPATVYKVFGQEAPFVTETEDAAWQRNLIRPTFGKPSINRFVHIVSAVAQELWQNCAASKTGFDVQAEARKFTTLIMYRVVVGANLNYKDITELQSLHLQLFNGLLAVPIDLPFTDLGRSLRARKQLVKIMDDRIAYYRQKIANMTEAELNALEKTDGGAVITGESVLHNILLSAHVQGYKITDSALQDACINLLAGGTDNTAAAITALVFFIARGPSLTTDATPSTPLPTLPYVVDNPTVLKLREEQAAVSEAHGADLAALTNPNNANDCLNDMKYLGACIQEALRLAPPLGAVFRGVAEDIKIGPTTIPKGKNLILDVTQNLHEDPLRRPADPAKRRCPFDISGRDRAALTHDGFDFAPDRWLKSAEESKFVESELDYEKRQQLFNPFGYGKHACTGRFLAVAELHVVVAELLRSYDMEVLALPEQFVRPSMYMVPKSEFRMRLIPKEVA